MFAVELCWVGTPLRILYFIPRMLIIPSHFSPSWWPFSDAMVVIWIYFLLISYTLGVPNIPQSELLGLQALYNATDGEHWSWNLPSNPIHGGFPWNFSQPSPNPCSQNWQGVDCTCTASICHVQGISLERHNLAGTLPSEVSSLTYLEQLVLPGNRKINGTIPSSWTSLQALWNLDLRQNSLNSSLPDWLPELRSLAYLNLSSNFFHGSIPESYFTMANLSLLSLQWNFLDGTLSSSLAGLSNCSVLELAFNFIHGTIPNEIGQMPSVNSIRLSSNLLVGTIPASLGNLTKLVELSLTGNALRGPIPPCLGYLPHLQALLLSENLLTGGIPETFANMSLQQLEIGYNLLTGPIPATLSSNLQLSGMFLNNNILTGNLSSSIVALQGLDEVQLSQNLLTGRLDTVFVGMPFINEFWVSNNMFTGMLPSCDWSKLFMFDCESNYFTGTIPAVYEDLFALNYFVLDNNLITGTIPSGLLNISALNLCSLSKNLLNGSIADVFKVGSQLVQLSLSSNRLTGTLPKSLANLTLLAQLDASYNMFTGRVPFVNSLEQMAVLYLSNNQFTGNLDDLVNPTTQQSLADLDLSHNFFTGHIPVAPFHVPTMNSFAISSNCLHGSLPQDVCAAANLSVLVFDGLGTATRCRKALFPGIAYLNAFVLKNVLTGTIPECLFALPKLRTLHLSGNGFTGTLPTNMSVAVLTDLVVSHNALSGTIPYALQETSMRSLDLSYNRFSGKLSSDFADGLNASSYYLQVNRLSGDIPSSLRNAQTISMLDGNIFYCDAGRDELPPNDPQTSIYVCGSNGVDYPLYTWLTVVGLVCCILTVWLGCVLWWKRTGDARELYARLQLRWRNINSALVRVEESTSMANIDLPDVKTIDSAELSTSMVEQSNSVSSMPTLSLHSTSALDLRVFPTAISKLMVFLTDIRRLFLVLTAFEVLVLIPLYGGFSSQTSTYEVSYGWQISAILLSGTTATAVLVTGFGFVLLFLVFLLLKAVRKLDPITATGLVNRRVARATRESARLLVFAFGNIAVMIAVDCAYVYVVLNYDATVVIVTQLSMACFKIFWNEIALWALIPMTKLDWVRAVIKRHRDRSATNAAPVNGATVNGARATGIVSWFVAFRKEQQRQQYSTNDVRFLIFNVLLNNIIVPAVAIACISTTCFNNALIAAPAQTDTYIMNTCEIYIANSHMDGCVFTIPSPNTISYDPPFLYSYQCASTITINYAPVFIYMFIASGLLMPFLKLAMHTVYHALADGKTKDTIRALLPHKYATPTAAKVGRFVNIFEREKLGVRVVNYLAIIISFGTIYPPISVLGCISLCIFTYSEQYILGYLLCVADSMGLKWYRDELGRQCAGIEELFRLTVWQIIPFASVVLGYLVFDTYGYSNGLRDGVLAAGLFVVWPAGVVVLCFAVQAGIKWRNKAHERTVEDGARATDWEVEVTIIHNPIAGTVAVQQVEDVESGESAK